MGVSEGSPRSALDTECVVGTTTPTEVHRVLVDEQPNVSYLRKRLDEHGAPLTHTVRGVGYAPGALRA